MTPEVISSAAAALLSLVFAYVPKADEWFAKLDAKSKAGILVGSIFLISAGAMGLSCANLFPGLTGLTCNQPGLEGLARSFVMALVANQTTYLIAPTSQKVKEINANK